MGNKIYLNLIPQYKIEDIYENLKEAYSFLNLKEVFKRGERILLKPNFLSGFRSDKRPITTNKTLIEAVILFFKDVGAKIYIGDSPALESSEGVAKRIGLYEICKKHGVKIVEFKEKREIDLPNFSTIKKINVAKEIFQFDHIINLPKLKTHTMMGLTLGVKNIYGVVVGREKAKYHLNSGENREIFAKMLLGLYESISPTLTILDGIISMEGNGPSNGRARDTGIFALSKDAKTLDVLISKILNFPEEKNYVIKVIKEVFPEIYSLNGIEFFPKGIKDFQVENFKLPQMIDCRWKLPDFIANYLRDLFSPHLVINTQRCIKCERCVEACPTDSIKYKGKNLKIYSRKCIRCFCCQEVCPEDAIFVKKSVF